MSLTLHDDSVVLNQPFSLQSLKLLASIISSLGTRTGVLYVPPDTGLFWLGVMVLCLQTLSAICWPLVVMMLLFLQPTHLSQSLAGPMMGLRRSIKHFIRFEGLTAVDPNTPSLLSCKSSGRRGCAFAIIGAFALSYLESLARSYSERTPPGGSAGELQ